MNAIDLRRAAIAVALLAGIVSAGCSERNTSTPATARTGPAGTPDPRSQVIGVEPGPPTKEAPATTSSAPSTVSKEQESKSMPLPGQVNDHSTLAKNPSQKAGTGGK